MFLLKMKRKLMFKLFTILLAKSRFIIIIYFSVLL